MPFPPPSPGLFDTALAGVLVTLLGSALAVIGATVRRAFTAEAQVAALRDEAREDSARRERQRAEDQATIRDAVAALHGEIAALRAMIWTQPKPQPDERN
jgi:hypothetical protein